MRRPAPGGCGFEIRLRRPRHGLSVTAGYRIIKWLAAEANDAGFGSLKDDISVDFEGNFTSIR